MFSVSSQSFSWWGGNRLAALWNSHPPGVHIFQVFSIMLLLLIYCKLFPFAFDLTHLHLYTFHTLLWIERFGEQRCATKTFQFSIPELPSKIVGDEFLRKVFLKLIEKDGKCGNGGVGLGLNCRRGSSVRQSSTTANWTVSKGLPRDVGVSL